MRQQDLTIPAGRFKAECLSLLDRVARTGRPVVVTKRGRPVARVVQIRKTAPATLRGSVRYMGDIVRPTGARWNAED